MPSRDGKIYPGQNVAIDAAFRDPYTNNYVDPGVVSFIAIKPDGTETMLSSIRVTLGKYRGQIVVDLPGTWYWRAVGEQGGEAAKEGSFKVEKSKFS